MNFGIKVIQRSEVCHTSRSFGKLLSPSNLSFLFFKLEICYLAPKAPGTVGFLVTLLPPPPSVLLLLCPSL